MVSWYLSPTVLPGQVMTEMNYPIYPEGMHASIMRAKAYGCPIYITETGIPDANDTHRALWIDSYMQQVGLLLHAAGGAAAAGLLPGR